MATRDEILSLIKPTVYGWIEEALGSSAAVSSNLQVVSGGASGAAGGDLAGTYPDPTVDGLQTRPVAATAPTTGQALVWNGSSWAPGGVSPSGAAGGDLAGTYPNPTVDGLQGRAVSATAPTPGQVYYWNGSLWLPGSISDIAGTITDAQHGSRGGGSLHAAATTTTPGFVELATSGETAAGVVVQGNDARLSDARTPTGTAGGDLAGTYPNPTVDGLQTRAVSATAPTTDDILAWTGSAWTPTQIRALGGGAGARCTLSSDQAITSASYFTVQFNTVTSNVNCTITTGASWACQVPVAGLYQVSVVLVLDVDESVIISGLAAELTDTSSANIQNLIDYDGDPDGGGYQRVFGCSMLVSLAAAASVRVLFSATMTSYTLSLLSGASQTAFGIHLVAGT